MKIDSYPFEWQLCSNPLRKGCAVPDGLILEYKMEQITTEQDKRLVDTIEKAIRELDEEAERMEAMTGDELLDTAMEGADDRTSLMLSMMGEIMSEGAVVELDHPANP